MSAATLRPAGDGDVDEIGDVWHEAWHAGHARHVPPELLGYRTRDHFHGRAAELIGRTTVAADRSGLAGFVTVTDDELEFLFVAERARGTGIAAELLTRGEQQIAGEHRAAWLEVVAGNARARRFYERQGWRDCGARDGVIVTPAGDVVVAYHRYEKWLRV